MTGRELIRALEALPQETLEDFDLSVKVGDEFFSLRALVIDDPDADGILDAGSPVLISEASKLIREEYQDGSCPRCWKEIPYIVRRGDACADCGYIFE